MGRRVGSKTVSRGSPSNTKQPAAKVVGSESFCSTPKYGSDPARVPGCRNPKIWRRLEHDEVAA